MSEQMTKSRLLDLIRSEHHLLESSLAQVSHDQMTQPGVEGEWSLKDLLAHITAWEKHMIRWLEETARGDVPEILPPGMTWDDLDQWNEQMVLENRDRPLAEVLADFHETYPQALGAAQAVSEEDLLDPQRFPWREGRPLWMMVAGNTYRHYEDHRQSIQAWLEGSG